jgi:hypothetical protein
MIRNKAISSLFYCRATLERRTRTRPCRVIHYSSFSSNNLRYPGVCAVKWGCLVGPEE